MNNWKETTLGEVAEVNPSETLKAGTVAKYVAMQHLTPFTREITQYETKEFKGGSKFRNGDTLLARITPCLENGKTAFVDFLEENEVAFGSTEFIVIREKKGASDKNFLFYFALSPVFREAAIKSMTGTSGRQRVQTDLIADKHFNFPSLPEQKAIAAILSSFDDKIELLRRQNKTLEKIAQTIFKEWFVKFTVNGKKLTIDKSTGLPEGWRVGKLGEELTVTIGGDWGEETKRNSEDVQVYCLRGTDIDSLKLSGYSEQVPLRWIRKNSLEKRVITENDILIGGSGLGPIGKTVYCHRNINLLYELPITYSNFCKRLTAKNKYYALYFEYFISALYRRGALERFSIGTSIPNLDINGLLEEKVIIPIEKHIEDFSKILDLKYSKLMNPQIQSLSKLRDTLLPKLMKGEIRVKS